MATQCKPIINAGNTVGPFSFRPSSFGLLQRVACLAGLFALELIAICSRFDSVLADDVFRHGGAAILRGVVAFAVLLASIGYAQARNPLLLISGRCVGIPVKFSLLFAHFAVMGAFGLVSARLFPDHSPGLETTLIASAWLALGLAAISLAAFAFAPAGLWVEAYRATGNVWIYSLIGGILASLLGIATQFLWKPATRVTFLLVKSILGFFVNGVRSDAAAHTIGTARFSVEIAPRCSGLEGAGLMLVVGALWLWLFRREFRFPRALLIVPVGVLTLYLLNAVRIAALILIGDAGAPEIATHGFHSQAGWIAFNAVAMCLLAFAPRVQWLASPEFCTTETPRLVHRIESGDSNAAYLMPLLTILMAAMLSRAASAQFEWLYPIRFIAAAAVLWHYRSEYRYLEWNFSWVSVATGAGVFAMWLGLDRWLGTQGDSAVIGSTLASAPQSAKVAWLVIRTLAAVITVPIAEELAFRGFLMRRIVSPAFTSVSSRGITPLAILVSSIAFGVLHGDRWIAGAVAGLLYALMYLRRGRIGDAVVAHATTNAILAGYVLLSGQWSLW